MKKGRRGETQQNIMFSFDQELRLDKREEHFTSELKTNLKILYSNFTNR